MRCCILHNCSTLDNNKPALGHHHGYHGQEKELGVFFWHQRAGKFHAVVVHYDAHYVMAVFADLAAEITDPGQGVPRLLPSLNVTDVHVPVLIKHRVVVLVHLAFGQVLEDAEVDVP